MHLQVEYTNDLSQTLEQQVEMQAEAAKRAIREYQQSLLEETAISGARRIERQRKVESAITKYMQLENDSTRFAPRLVNAPRM